MSCKKIPWTSTTYRSAIVFGSFKQEKREIELICFYQHKYEYKHSDLSVKNIHTKHKRKTKHKQKKTTHKHKQWKICVTMTRLHIVANAMVNANHSCIAMVNILPNQPIKREDIILSSYDWHKFSPNNVDTRHVSSAKPPGWNSAKTVIAFCLSLPQNTIALIMRETWICCLH